MTLEQNEERGDVEDYYRLTDTAVVAVRFPVRTIIGNLE